MTKSESSIDLRAHASMAAELIENQGEWYELLDDDMATLGAISATDAAEALLRAREPRSNVEIQHRSIGDRVEVRMLEGHQSGPGWTLTS